MSFNVLRYNQLYICLIQPYQIKEGHFNNKYACKHKLTSNGRPSHIFRVKYRFFLLNSSTPKREQKYHVLVRTGTLTIDLRPILIFNFTHFKMKWNDKYNENTFFLFLSEHTSSFLFYIHDLQQEQISMNPDLIQSFDDVMWNLIGSYVPNKYCWYQLW